MQYCTRCLNVGTRPRIGFNEEGVCNACQWAEAKRTTVDWKARWRKLEEICDRYRITDGANWDIIVPCSGGKDGSYVAWKMKHELGMHPLCVTVMPQTQTEIGRQNLENFKKSGFDHIAITPNPKVYQRFAKRTFIEQGRPKHPFEVGIATFTMNIAIRFNIQFIMYGEEGESEYGGVMTMANRPEFNREELVNIYFSGHDNAEFLDEFSKEELIWWLLPGQEEMDKIGLFPTHWSHYENWDPWLHAELAREKCGLQTVGGTSIGTFTDYAQLDDVLQDLHAYLMFIKLGFGRTTSDVGIEIRAGRMTREEGLELVKKHDGTFPEKYLPDFLDYFEMTEKEFWQVVDSFANKDVLKKVNGRWVLKEEPH